MSYLLFVLPIVGLLAVFGISLRAPGDAAADDAAFSFASENS